MVTREQLKLWKTVNWSELFHDKELWDRYAKVWNELYGPKLVPNRADKRRMKRDQN